MALELGYLKGSYIKFWFDILNFMLQDHCVYFPIFLLS